MSRVLFCVSLLAAIVSAQPAKEPMVSSQSVRFEQSATAIDAYDYVEATAHVNSPASGNPFLDASLTGTFQGPDGAAAIPVTGFCDSADGSVFRIRFMPTRPGAHQYSVTYKHAGTTQTHAGSFEARAAGRRGIVRVDRQHPWHFLWEGTGEHYFWNGTTTYALVGWDEQTIRQTIDRLHALKVNRLRVSLLGPRVESAQAWFEPQVKPTERFGFTYNPWLAARPDSVEDPGFDVTRFNIEHWQKYERLLRYAREKDVVISVIFYVDGARKGTDPFGKEKRGGEDEQRYYRYAAARLSAFSNIMWDVTNEYRLFRNDEWMDQMGSLLKSCDPYQHLASCHGHETFTHKTSPWVDFAMYQSWDEWGGNGFMLKNRAEQADTGRPMPQVNEEYGYEDHYPQGWGGARNWPTRTGDTRRRLAWEMYMAGTYQTTGETAATGTGAARDTGGGWVNGRGDETMTMLHGYAHIVDFFTRLAWWKLEPHNELASDGALCLAQSGRCYVAYLPKGGQTTLTLDGAATSSYIARWYNPRRGEYLPLPVVQGSAKWTSPPSPDAGDWVLLLEKQE